MDTNNKIFHLYQILLLRAQDPLYKQVVLCKFYIQWHSLYPPHLMKQGLHEKKLLLDQLTAVVIDVTLIESALSLILVLKTADNNWQIHPYQSKRLTYQVHSHQYHHLYQLLIFDLPLKVLFFRDTNWECNINDSMCVIIMHTTSHVEESLCILIFTYCKSKSIP